MYFVSTMEKASTKTRYSTNRKPVSFLLPEL